jgi:hypothetical protein
VELPFEESLRRQLREIGCDADLAPIELGQFDLLSPTID